MHHHPSKNLVLIVDDDPGLVRLVEKSLRREGCAVASAFSGAQAIRRLETDSPALLLLDLKLPDFDGQDLVRRLETHQRPVPFIVMTGQGDERVAVEMMKRGALDYLVKDAQFHEVLPAVVRRALRQIEQEQRLAAAEEALDREHALTAAILDTSAALVVVLDRQARIVRFNRACERLTGCAFPEAKGERFFDRFIAPAERPRVEAIFSRLCQGETQGEHENYLRVRDGSPRLIRWSNTVLAGRDGAIEYIVATGLDITEHKRLEKEVLEISELEQRRIGQDLHDGICQQLAAIELMSDVLEKNLARKARAEASQAGRIAKHVREAIAQTRRLARGLIPVELEAHGLMGALEELAAVTGNIFRVACRFRCPAPVPVPNNVVATHLFRIAQEAVSNGVRHGGAHAIEIELGAAGDRIQLSVRDDGSGFSEAEAHSGGMGLRIMRYRAAIIGASLAIQKDPRGGTAVICSVPEAAAGVAAEPAG